MSTDLQWMIIRNNSSFLVRRPGLTLTKEPNNLKCRNSYRFNGLVRKRTIGIEPTSDNNGIVLVTKNIKSLRKPAKSTNRVTLKRGSRRTLNTLKKMMKNNKYRKDLTTAALRRASAMLKSQKPYVPKKVQKKKKD